jgi:hypothetical protein
LIVAAAVAVLALTAGAVFLFTRSGQNSGTLSGQTTVTSTLTISPTTPTPSASTGASDDSATTGTPTDTGTEPGTPTEPASTPTVVGVVELSPDLVADPAARRAAATLSAFFTAITDRQFRDAYALYTSAARKRLGSYSTWSAGYTTTSYDGITLSATETRGGGVLVAHVTFTSHQSPRNAPDRSSECLVWDLAYRLVPTRGTPPFRIDRVESDAPAGAKPFRACP